MKTYFVISDIHSFYSLMIKALQDKGFDINNKDHIIILCGDAFDRGSEAVKVFNFLKQLKEQDRLIYIKGNHEDLLFDCIEELKEYDGCASSCHYSNGTVDTIIQFKQEDILGEVLDFINCNAINYFELNGYIFAHASIPLKEINNKLILDEDANIETWKNARWENPIQNLKNNYLPTDKILVVGHWHSSALWTYLCPNKYSEFKEEGKIYNSNLCRSNNLIMLDACTAYSNRVNVLVIHEDKKEENKDLIKNYPFLLPSKTNYDYSYICLDLMPSGWRIVFGNQLCEDIKAVLDKDLLQTYKIFSIDEKYGEINIISNTTTDKIEAIVDEYNSLIKNICIKCGNKATKFIEGIHFHVCDKCYDNYFNNFSLK